MRESEIDEQGRNETQRRLDEEGVEPRPVDAPWPTEEEPAADRDPSGGDDPGGGGRLRG